MKMVMLMYRHAIDQDIRGLLKELDVSNFTEAPKVMGIGEAGHPFGSLTWPGHQAIIFSAMEELQADRVIGVLKEFRDHMVQLRGGTKIPRRVFVLPCERVL